ncbi:AraC family transcriptional regulator [Robiginitalea sp. M366]|uniref:helix-turn-helix domain-containing protein n=1 Tax=Robiginitalea aestuariiviva TaxID=3036903 RepID=UPI00240D1DE7|nr:AraC family transcriptional regulator [Robiginitalea aestuariiviva]MDG1572655.1 AraC family transcriptional regulator [Robiginitalea aestuariiviva]
MACQSWDYITLSSQKSDGYLMDYTEKIVDHPVLKREVLCYWQMKGYIDTLEGIQSRYLPKGQNLLVFNYGDPIERSSIQEVSYLDTNLLILPAIATCRMVKQKGQIDLFGISFIADGLYKQLHLPISKIGRGSSLGIRKYQELFIQLKGKKFWEKSALAESFMLENSDQKKSSIPFQKAIDIIHEKYGVISINDLARLAHVSERQLQRLFKIRMGISPKNYCKIIRVNNYLDHVMQNDHPVDWMDLVTQYGYHDQPHLINELKSISRISPQKLLKYRDTLYHRYTKG